MKWRSVTEDPRWQKVEPPPYPPQRAFVVFTGATHLVRLCVLHPYFRHCYVMLHDGHQWLTIDPMAGYIEATMHRALPGDFDLPGWLADRGDIVVEAPMRPRHTVAPAALLTCTEVCKRFLGIHNAFIITPYQLYKHLTGGRLCAGKRVLTARAARATSPEKSPVSAESGKCAPITAQAAARGT